MSSHEFHPNWASAPGDTILDILSERDITVVEFANRVEESLENIEDLLQGRATITLGVARKLEGVLGASVEFWISRDFQYRQSVDRLHQTNRQWLSQFPVGDMIKFGWIKPKPRPSDEVSACLQYFNVPSVSAWHEVYGELQQMAAFRTSPSLDSRPGAVAAWLRQGEIEAEASDCKPWSPERFRELLPHIRALTREKDPECFIPALQKCCAEAGVAVAVVRGPTGCRASGATRFLTPDKALLLLSFRYLSDDQFWFTFFHEAGHLLLHGKTTLFVEGLDTSSTAQEREANEFAAQMLIPEEFSTELLSLGKSSHEIVRFARKIGVSPGIVVGQLQHFGKVKRNYFNALKRRFEWQNLTSLSRGSS
jgi:HTH-type transcriptional regulator/antitoxin HigA